MNASTWGSVGRRLGRHLVIAAALIALIATPAVVVASHFTDVPPSNQYYVAINNVAGAGITTGCSATTYCPAQDVTREQMAAFLNRTGPRLSISYINFPLGNTPGQQPAHNSLVASTPVRAIGSEALMIRANFYTVTYGSGSVFPCEVLYKFRIDGTLVGGNQMYHRENAAPPNSWFTKQMTGEYAIVVTKGDHVVQLVYQRVSANACSVFPGAGTLIVEPIPFRWDQGTYGFGAAPAEAGAPEDLDTLEEVPILQSNGAPLE